MRDPLLDLDEIISLRRSESCIDSTRTMLGKYGVTAFVLAQIPQAGGAQPEILLDQWPQGLAERYIQEQQFRHDAVSRYCITKPAPIRWSEIPTCYLNPEASKVLADAGEFGLSDGICVPLNMPLGQGALELAGRRIDFVPGLRALLKLLAYQLLEIEGARTMVEYGSVRLTPRETEVLKWFAVGKTTDAVGQILKISPHTVGEHLKSIRRKLQTNNVAHSVIRALQLGQLHL